MAKTISFEKSMKRLEEIVMLLESGEQSLDDSISLFQEGLELSKKCHDKLNSAEQKITEITVKDQNKAED